jgi:hypothetical protein
MSSEKDNAEARRALRFAERAAIPRTDSLTGRNASGYDGWEVTSRQSEGDRWQRRAD